MTEALRDSSEHELGDRPLEIGERVRFRSPEWEVADTTERVVTLFGREASADARRGRGEPEPNRCRERLASVD